MLHQARRRRIPRWFPLSLIAAGIILMTCDGVFMAAMLLRHTPACPKPTPTKFSLP